jgi:DNA helicase HerA-like ATPase
VADLLHGQTLYTNLEVLPALMREIGPELGAANYKPRMTEFAQKYPGGQSSLLPIKTVPSHHAPVRRAHAGDVADIFGDPEDPGQFIVGYTREQGHPVCIDLKKFVQRSSGIFGATGTGKSFLTRILLAGLIQSNQASVLVLDMHNEYGFDSTSSDTNSRVVGLKTKFAARVRVVGLGRGSTIRGQRPDFDLEIGEDDIMTSDVEMLTRELNLKETTPTTLDALYRDFGRHWFHEFKILVQGKTVEDENGKTVPANGSVEYWARQAGVNELAATGLHSKMGRVFGRKYVVEKPASNVLGEIIKALEAGQHVVLSYGENQTDLDYLLVANLLTRRIREVWEERTNAFRGQNEKEPRSLVIVVEEAHKLLNREMAAQTAFSTIAREMRKYYVTLLIIDQRPSQIYDEVMSQLGTRISGWLGDEDDIQAVLSGLAGRDALRGMLSRLQPKEEVVLLGWGVPMPLPVRSRRYDDRFWQELLRHGAVKRTELQNLGELGYT